MDYIVLSAFSRQVNGKDRYLIKGSITNIGPIFWAKSFVGPIAG